MNITELTLNEVIGFNRRAILDGNRRDPARREQHNLIRTDVLQSALAGIFFQSGQGYMNLPVEKMAALLLCRISQGQAFENGNKRTAVLSAYFFLWNHGLKLKVQTDEIVSLLWDLANKVKNEDDVFNFILNNVFPR